MMTVHGVPQSPFVRKVLAFLEEKHLAYEQVPLVPFPKTPELLAMSPLGKIPVLQDGDLTTRDSSVICAYLERKHPTPALYPADARDLARVLWYEEYADTRLVEVLTVPFFERVVRPNVFHEATDEQRVQTILTESVPPVLDYLERQVPDGAAIAGGLFSIGDIALCSPFVNFQLAGETIDASRWPRLARYVRRTLARPSFERAIGLGAQAA